MVVHPTDLTGELVPELVAGIRIERWQRTVTPTQVPEITIDRAWPSDCFLQRLMSSDRTKVEGAHPAHGPQKATPKQPFGQVLKKQQHKPGAVGQMPPPLPKPIGHKPLTGAKGIGAATTITGVRATALTSAHAPQLASTENLTQVRAGMNTQAGLLREVRTEGQAQNEEKVNARVLDLIVKELSADLGGNNAPPAQPATTPEPNRKPDELPGVSNRTADQGLNAGLAPAKVDPAQVANAKAQAAAALVERIEVFVKSNRPALAVTLSGAINAKVEVERTGPGEVSLRVQGTRGPPPAEDLARIREAVKERGLKLSSLSVG